MHKILQDIINSTTEEVKKRKSQSSIDDLVSYDRFPFKHHILNPIIGDIGLIAEVKLASPTEGKLGEKVDILNRLQEYQNAGADAVSVITENKNFGGSLDLVSTLKRSTLSLPILQKDFVIDDFQIEESRRLGADALLLIARIVNATQLKRFVKQCIEKELEPIVEVCSLDDLSNAINSGTKIIAVNARDLDTFEVDIERACNILKKIPKKFIKLGFSGIHSRYEVEKYKKAGAKAILVGTQLMKTNNIGKLIKQLKRPVRVKICGIRSIEAAKAAIEAGADFLGFNFVPSSKRYIAPIAALKIINSIRGQIKIVGIFQNTKIAEVNKIVSDLKLDFVQLHGNENNEYINMMVVPVIKSLTENDRPDKIRANYYLLDRSKRGKGEMVDLEKAAGLARSYQIFYAGGLNPDNVEGVINEVQPFAVDVAGGIETNGYQDTKKIKLFILRSKRALLIRNAKGESL